MELGKHPGAMGMSKKFYNIPKGYHLRNPISSVFSFVQKMKCQSCGRKVSGLISLERDYPKDKDILVCDQCLSEYSDDEGWDE